MPGRTVSAVQPTKSKRPLRLILTAECGAAHATFIAHHVKLAHAMIRAPLTELSIALVSDQRMSELHERFMSIAGPTDVLTFPLEQDADGNTISGELVLCVPEARRRAKEQGVPLPHELLLYAIHGMLHLSGYDDRTGREYKVMHAAEDDLLCRLGIGPVFRPATCPLKRTVDSSRDNRRQRRVH